MLGKEEVRHIANLARIGITDKEVEKFSVDLSAVLDWIKQLEEVDIANISPTARVSGMTNASRGDLVQEFLNSEEIIKLFPEEKNGYDKVKSVL